MNVDRLKSWMVARQLSFKHVLRGRVEGIVHFWRIQNISLFFGARRLSEASDFQVTEMTKKRFLSKGRAPLGGHRRAVNAVNLIRLTRSPDEIHSEAGEPASGFWHFRRASDDSAGFPSRERCAVFFIHFVDPAGRLPDCDTSLEIS